MRGFAVAVSFLCAIGCFADASKTFDRARGAVHKACGGATDLNHDGYNEVEFIHQTPYEAAGGDKGTVVVMVESRLLQPLGDSLTTYVNDLANEGHNTFAVEVKLEPGTKRQGGLTTLALRRFLQKVYKADPTLKGVLLVGRFPYAMIVRQHYWERGDDVTFNRGRPEAKSFHKTTWIRDVPEMVALTADIVLGDLDGNWEPLYRQAETQVPYFHAVFPGNDHEKPTKDYEIGSIPYSDFFLVNDGEFKVVDAADGKRFIRVGNRDQECAKGDLKLPNPMSLPEIAVSHLDASMVAFSPTPAMIDGAGRPRAEVKNGQATWAPDPILERKLLVEYFQRNHVYRTGVVSEGRLPASFSSEWDSSVPDFTKNVKGWEAVDTKGLDFVGSVSIDDWVQWMERPALVRAIKAHSNGHVSEFGNSRDHTLLNRLVGGAIWGWDRGHDGLVETNFNNGLGRFELFRTLYENHVLPPTPNMFLHTGCESTVPWSWENLPFGDPNWGKFQNAEALMMFCNGLVLVGRGKVFCDEPAEVGKLLGEGKTWGDIWTNYFSYDAAQASLNSNDDVRIARKQPYFWNVIGDWTLTLAPVLSGK